MTFFIHAPNVHQGGGLTLLKALLAHTNQDTCCVLDERMAAAGLPSVVKIKAIRPTLLSRLNAEVWLFKRTNSEDFVLCFGNLPPLLKSRARAAVFLQNRYLFGMRNFSEFSWGVRLRLRIERWWFRARMQAGYQIIVQSLTMQRELKQDLGFDSIVLPFLGSSLEEPDPKNNVKTKKEFDFVYVSSAEPHKNHAALLDAWVLLAEQGIHPSLALTVSENTATYMAQLIELKKQSYGLNIMNFGTMQHGDVRALYQKSNALIFPSKLESFGLPLLEAKQLGMPILAPELDYVRDVVEPDQTFDPNSPTSIARAVLRHLNIHAPKTEPVDAATFLAQIQKWGDK